MPTKPTLALVSLGCAKNAADLEVMAGDLLASGYELSPDPDVADVAIVNTCSFIAAAREEAEREILRALELKRRGSYGRVVVAGCYPQRYPKAAAKFPGVDAWQGVPKEWTDGKMPAFRLTGKAFAYLKIAEGCVHRCSYCAIPSIRGRFRSRPADSIIKEAKALLATGCRELNIVAQDPMMYGRDAAGGIGLSGLLRRLDRLRGDFWIRVLYSYPSEIDGDFVSWMLSSKHAVRYVDMPIQHTVPKVLAKMNRRRAIDASLEMPGLLRDVVDGITLRTTVITGFPGETDADFAKLRSDLARMQFDRLGAFAYSPEKGTKAALMPGRPSKAVALLREKAVMDDAAKLWRQKAKALIGKEFKALVVAPGVARMESQAPDVDGVTYLLDTPGARKVSTGEFTTVRLVRAAGFDFEGEVV